MSAHMMIKSKKLLRTVPEVLHLKQVIGQCLLHFRYCGQNSGCCLVLLGKMDLAVDEINHWLLMIQSFQHKSL